jgi:2-(1,2-epoxy-1,2-dihydrophenyl)acetyl-CoA isomerase
MLASGNHRLIRSVHDCRLPVVAAVQGAARGFGLHLAMAADFVIAGRQASFGEPFTDRGFSVDSGGSWLLPRRVGIARAKRLLYTAEEIDADTALDWGLIDELVDPATLEAAARRMAEMLASRPTQALAATKRLLHDHAVTDLDQALDAEAMAVELTVRSNDFKEGMAAFAERRPPRFTGS